MNIVSTETRWQVKHKPQNISALPDSANLQLEIPPAEPAVKEPQAQDLQKSDPAARERFKLRLDLPVIPARRDGKGLSLPARYILGIITAYLHYGCWRPLSMETIARAARCGRAKVIKAIRELKAARYLDVDDDGKCHWYRVPMLLRRVAKIWVNPALVRDDGLSIVQACFVGYVKFRQGDNGVTWFTHQEAAETLGVSYPTAARAAAQGAARGYVQKRHRPRRQSSKNSYALTCKADETIGVSGLELARSKSRALGQTNREGGSLYANCVRNGISRDNLGLSFDSRQDRAAYAILRKYGVHWSVAKPVAVQWRGRYESVQNMILIGMFRRDDYLCRARRSGVRPGRFNLAGYLVGGLNMANAEGHDIELTRVIKAKLAKGCGGALAAAGGKPSESELAELEKYAETVLKPCLVEPHTPENKVK